MPEYFKFVVVRVCAYDTYGLYSGERLIKYLRISTLTGDSRAYERRLPRYLTLTVPCMMPRLTCCTYNIESSKWINYHIMVKVLLHIFWICKKVTGFKIKLRWILTKTISNWFFQNNVCSRYRNYWNCYSHTKYFIFIMHYSFAWISNSYWFGILLSTIKGNVEFAAQNTSCAIITQSIHSGSCLRLTWRHIRRQRVTFRVTDDGLRTMPLMMPV